MGLKIRLSRGGAKKRPFYRVVVADVRSPRDGRYIERLGTYNPLLGKDDENRLKLNTDRIQHWLGVGAQPTERVARFLGGAGLVDWKHGKNMEKAKPGVKAQERLDAQKQAEEDAKAAAAAEAEAPAEEEAAAEEAPAEEEAKA